MASDDLYFPADQLVLLSLLAILGAVGLLLRGRTRRLRKWQLILEEPASSVAFLRNNLRHPPKWIQALPQGVDLATESSLFDVLYKHFRTHPATFDSHVLGLTLSQLEPADGKTTGTPAITKGSGLSAEDNIKALLGTQSLPTDLVPTDALTENVLLNLVNVLKGKKKLTIGLEHALLDSLGAAGGIAGSKVGGVVGVASASLLAGVSLPLVPILVVLGAWVGSLAGKRAGGWFKNWRYFSALKQLRRASRGFKKWFIAQFPEFLTARDQDFKTALEQTRSLFKQSQNGALGYLRPGLMTIFFKQSLIRLSHDRLAEARRLERLRGIIEALDAVEFAAILGRLSEPVARTHPQLLKHYHAYHAALEALKSARGIASEEVSPKSA